MIAVTMLQDGFRVVHLIPALFGDGDGVVGGAERYAVELARFMSKRARTTLISFGVRSRQWSEGELEVRVLGRTWHVRGQEMNPFSLELVGALKEADVIHVHQQHVVASSLAAILARMRGQRVFVTDLGGGGWDISGYVSTDTWYDGHLHISEYSRRIFGHGDNPHAHVIYGGVDTEKFWPDPSGGRTKTLLFVGRLLPHKGVDVLIDALDEGLRLEVIGRPYDEEYLGCLHERAVGKEVVFRHDVTDAELVSAYQRAACVVLPSVYRDIFGNETKVPELLGQTLLEGMACGTPAVCTDVASMPEVVRHGKTGIVVPPNDPAALRASLQEIVGDPDLAASMGLAAREDVLARFSWQSVVDRCLTIYNMSE